MPYFKIFSQHDPIKLQGEVDAYLEANAEVVTFVSYQTELVQNAVHYSVAVTTNITPLRPVPIIPAPVP